jgi:hypothetical protein
MNNFLGFDAFSIIGWSFIPQLLCVFHAYKTGRREWILPLLIFSFPAVIVYVIFEIYPEIKHGDFGKNAVRIFLPNWKIKDMQRKFNISDTVTNRLNLAEAYAEQKQYKKAIELAEVCANDPYINHSGIYLKLARLYFQDEQYEKALSFFSKAKELNYNRFDRVEDELFVARAKDYLGDKDNAETDYKNVIRVHHSMEGMYHYGKMLRALGRGDEAMEQFIRVKTERELNPRYVRRLNAKWIRLSAQERRA